MTSSRALDNTYQEFITCIYTPAQSMPVQAQLVSFPDWNGNETNTVTLPMLLDPTPCFIPCESYVGLGYSQTTVIPLLHFTLSVTTITWLHPSTRMPVHAH